MHALRPCPKVACFLLVLGSQPGIVPLEAQETTPLTAPVTIALEPWVGTFLTVRGVVGGRPVSLLFDTGGGETLLAPRVVEGSGCGAEGRAVGFRMSGERVEWARCRGLPVELAGGSLLPRTVGVFDVMPLFGDQLPPGTPPVDGVLSLDAARGRRLTLDLASRTLTLESDSSFLHRTARMHEVPARIATGQDGGALTVLLRATLLEGGHAVWLLLDSGNVAGLLLDGSGVPTGFEGGEVRLDFGGGIVVTGSARTAELIYDGALSWHEIRSLAVSLDLAEGRAWLGLRAPGGPW